MYMYILIINLFLQKNSYNVQVTLEILFQYQNI